MAAPRRPRSIPKPPSFSETVAVGDRRASLVALRDHLARTLETADRDHASLARQLREVIREIDELPSLQQESTLDEITNRRAARRAKAEDRQSS